MSISINNKFLKRNIHYNKDWDRKYRPKTVLKLILKRNIHYNKDWDNFHPTLKGIPMESLKRNIHYNKDWDRAHSQEIPS